MCTACAFWHLCGGDSCLLHVGHLEGPLDAFGLPMDCNGRSNHMLSPRDESLVFAQSPGWQNHSMPVASSNAFPGSASSGVAQFLGMA